MEETVMTEQQLISDGQLMVQEAHSLTIHTQEEYEAAAGVLTDIKTKIKAVKDYWASPKAAAAQAHKAICQRENEMIKPLMDAEAEIKHTMVAYQLEIEKARIAAEEEARKARQEEIDRELEKSIKAQEEGDENAADAHIMRAEMLEQVKPKTTPAPSAAGTSVRKEWKARVTDATLVPAYASGIEIREISMSALNKLAKLTEGRMTLPGVEFYQETSISTRGRQ